MVTMLESNYNLFIHETLLVLVHRPHDRLLHLKFIYRPL